MTFAHLHVHTEYSMLDGAARVRDLARRAAELGQPALAMTDHGVLFGAYDFHAECVASGVKPIIGMEAYVAPEHRTLRERVTWGDLEEDGKTRGVPGAYTHLTLLAQDAEGLRNLYRLHELSYREGQYYKPRIDREVLAQHARGLVATTGCPGGEVSTRLRLGQAVEAVKAAGELKDIFGDRLYVELMLHGMEMERALIPGLIDVARTVGAPLVATNDSHYTLSKEADVHDALLCLQTNARITDQNRFRFSGSGYYLKSRAEMDALELPREALDNTLLVADGVSGYGGVFEHRLRMPEAILPDGWDAEEALNNSAVEGLRGRVAYAYGDTYDQRLTYELNVIIKMGYADYFLVLADLIGWAKRKGIRVGPGRGSAGGSLVAYALQITDLDPIEHGLLFERFLNPSRVSLPDIDVDIDDTRRNEVIAYAAERYGRDRVAQVLTLGTIGAKRAITDSARVMGKTYSHGQRLLGGLPPARFGRAPSLADGTWNEASDDDAEVLQLATGLEGLIRNTGIHAAAVIISPEPIGDVLPVWVKDGQTITGFDQGPTTDLGLVKYDFLGLKNLGIIDECLHLLSREQPVALPSVYDDPATFALLQSGNTLGVFQLDGSGMRGLLRTLRPTSFGDIAAVLSLYRPGPMGVGAHTEYAHRKNGRAGIAFPHPEYEGPLSAILSSTYGLVVFQEQVLQILNTVCGWDYSEAALIFDAMRKKDVAKLAEGEPAFRAAAASNGYSQDAIEALWNVLVPFADYSFNKAHATGYAIVAYWTGWLKANHPAEYMSVLLSKEGDPDKLTEYITEAQKIGLKVMPPDINDSGSSWTPVRGAIRYGLASIKGVGEKAVEALVRNRPYRGLDDFLRRADPKALNAGVLLALVRAGALDSLHPDRGGLLRSATELAERALADRAKARMGDTGLYRPSYRPGAGTATKADYRAWERETLGVELTIDDVHLRATRPLTEAEWWYVLRVISANPGPQPVSVGYASWRMKVRQTVRWSGQMAEQLEPLGVVEVEIQ